MQPRLSATEAGLLTVAERRGEVFVRRVLDERNDAIDVERREVLRRLQAAGLLAETDGDPEHVTYALTEEGRQALAALDAEDG